MTIRTCWCPDCGEVCTDHARVCTTCGAHLVEPPATNNNGTSTRGPSFRAMPDLGTFANHNAGSSLYGLIDQIGGVRQQVREATRVAARHVPPPPNNNAAAAAASAGALMDMLMVAATRTIHTNTNNNGDWQNVPAALLDPQQASRERPTAASVLQSLPRHTLHERSQQLFNVDLQVQFHVRDEQDNVNNDNDDEQEHKVKRCKKTNAATTTTMALAGVTGQLGLLPLSSNSNSDTISVQGPLWIPETRAERTGQKRCSRKNNIPTNAIILLERGNGINFVQKVLPFQQLGAAAIIMVHDQPSSTTGTGSWPYLMTDSRTPRQKDAQPITIPVVMVKLEDGTAMLEHTTRTTSTNPTSTTASCTLTIARRNTADHCCIVCTEPMDVGQTVVTLKQYCGHVFHEPCALQWLQSHHTCPYCRQELPTDDKQDQASASSQRRRRRTDNDRSRDRESLYG